MSTKTLNKIHYLNVGMLNQSLEYVLPNFSSMTGTQERTIGGLSCTTPSKHLHVTWCWCFC